MSYCFALYCIRRPFTEGRLDRYRIGIPRELSEIRTQPWLSEDPYYFSNNMIFYFVKSTEQLGLIV